MNLIKLSATHSTNTFLSELVRDSTLQRPSGMLSENQTGGRGQRGNDWYCEAGRSLAMSIYIKPNMLLAKDQFYLSMLVSLSVKEGLKGFGIPQVSVKWPNDIL